MPQTVGRVVGRVSRPVRATRNHVTGPQPTRVLYFTKPNQQPFLYPVCNPVQIQQANPFGICYHLLLTNAQNLC